MSTFSDIASTKPGSEGHLHFAGSVVNRPEALDALDEILVKSRVAEIVGQAGTGKTTLTNLYARHARHLFGDRIVDFLAYPGGRLTDYIDNLVERFRSFDGPGLLVVDRAESLDPHDALEAVRRMETGPWDVRFLFVSRVALGLGTAISVDGFHLSTFRELLRKRLGFEIPDAEAETLWRQTGGSPSILQTLVDVWPRDPGRPAGQLGALLSPIDRPGLLGPDGRPLRRGSRGERAIVEHVRFVTGTMLHQVAVRPELVFEMTSREFEQFAAELFERQGFEVELTKATRDGGKDLYVARSDVMGSFRYAVECKRYAPDYPVRVDVIRNLHAVVDIENLTAGMVLTTSRFTRDARAEASKIAYRMSLRDFAELKAMLEPYGPE